MKYVFICSPYHAENKPGEVQDNVILARKLCMQAIREGYIPMAPHLYFTQLLDDNNDMHRQIGCHMGLEWMKNCVEVWVCGNKITSGMAQEITEANRLNIPIKIRQIG